MPFPEVPRIIYKRNPLDKVVCQFRFPPILKIDTEIPASFQESVRGHFPKFSEKHDLRLNLPEGISDQFPNEILQQMTQSIGGKNYEFSSEDDLWKINLTRNFVALTAYEYKQWEIFKEKLEIPFSALKDVYSPSYFSRLGLRYIDIIRRSKLGLKNVSWDKLLKPYIIGILGVKETGKCVAAFESIYEISLSDQESLVRIATRFVKAKDNDEICYMIDSDFFRTKKTAISEAIDKLNFFNKRASRLIQWSITKRLHKAMQPRTPEEI